MNRRMTLRAQRRDVGESFTADGPIVQMVKVEVLHRLLLRTDRELNAASGALEVPTLDHSPFQESPARGVQSLQVLNGVQVPT